MSIDLSCLQAGQRIFVAGSSNEPTGLLEQMRDADLPEGLHFVQFPLAGYNQTDFTAWHPSFEMTTVFMTSHLKGADKGRLHFVPMQMRAVYDYLLSGIDVALIQVARGHDAKLRLGPNVDFAEAVLASARFVLAEVNEGFAAPAGCPAIEASRLDATVTTHRPLFELPRPTIDAAAREIGRHVAGLIADGDCLQTGIGAIPAAILGELGDKNDLGLHGGLIDDGGMHLVRDGIVNGANKPTDKGLHIAGMALGSRELIDCEVNGKAKKIRAINLMARRMFKKGREGDVAAAKECGDRLDGKPVQGVELGLDVKITRIERHIVAPAIGGPIVEGVAVEVSQAIESNGKTVKPGKD